MIKETTMRMDSDNPKARDLYNEIMKVLDGKEILVACMAVSMAQHEVLSQMEKFGIKVANTLATVSGEKND